VKTLFETLKGKLIIVENIVQASTVTEFIEKGAEP